MNEQQKQLVAKLKDAQNVLVTVSKDPSVDQLAAAIGLTLALSKLDKHATAVYSGKTPSVIEFLKPEKTLETNTDSLRDFIIALDKAKADKLRYKVEDEMVRIFITPYRTSISQNDLQFSQGDFNVDVVVALGVQAQADLDSAVQAHGRILHDAAVTTVSISGQSELGTINLLKPEASSLCEVVSAVVKDIDKDVFDGQIATALLTGIVAMTDRFCNERTTPETMNISAVLMSAGANQQLIATELATPEEETTPAEVPSDEQSEPKAEPNKKEPGTLEIAHGKDEKGAIDDHNEDAEDNDSTAHEDTELQTPQIQVDEDGQLITEPEMTLPKIQQVHGRPLNHHDGSAVSRDRLVEPPSLGGMLTANTDQEDMDVPAENLTQPSTNMPLLDHANSVLRKQDDTLEEATSPASQPASNTPPSLDTANAPVTNLFSPTEFAPEASSQSVTPSLDSVLHADNADTTDAIVAPSIYDTTLPSEENAPLVSQPTNNDGNKDEIIDTSLQTLSDIEAVVDSPHLSSAGKTPSEATPTADSSVEDARNAVEAALAGTTQHRPDVAHQAAPLFDVQAPTAVYPNTPQPDVADTLDMPLPSPGAGAPAYAAVAPSAFPGVVPQTQQQGVGAPPTVPPPPIFPMA